MEIKRNEVLAKKLNIIAYILSAVVISLVIFTSNVKIPVDADLTFLPGLNSILNTCVAICLMASFYFIKKKDVATHQKLNWTAFALSLLFLLCYVVYRFTNEETKYCGEGAMKVIYLLILISHIILAGLSLPFILLTFIKGYCGLIEEHRKMAKWVFPIWLYVALTGPICYLLLHPCYK